MAGYPHITVPMEPVHGLPVGLSFVGLAWSEAALIGYAYAYEQASRQRVAPRFLLSKTQMQPTPLRLIAYVRQQKRHQEVGREYTGSDKNE